MLRHAEPLSSRAGIPPSETPSQNEMHRMYGSHPLKDMLRRRAEGDRAGLCAACTAHPLVLKAALTHAAKIGRPFLIEATANQVNQDGGYTGMTPMDYRAFVAALAKEAGCPPQLYLLGGDHLGPLVWRDRPAAEAMQLSLIHISQGIVR